MKRKSGGSCQPATLAIILLAIPVGESNSARANAAAAWGIASTGADSCAISLPARPLCDAAKNKKTLTRERAGVSRPARRLVIALVAIPGVEKSAIKAGGICPAKRLKESFKEPSDRVYWENAGARARTLPIRRGAPSTRKSKRVDQDIR